jgi:tRNA pseudouridine13 synthase
LWVEKAGLSTVQAAGDIARELGVRHRDIGYAGLKDARAVTRQWFSVEHVEPERVLALDIPRLRVLEVSRHGNKLRIGHLAGNRFVIKVRRTAAERLAELQDGLARLASEGLPNYFGHQRFGGRGDTWAVGGALLRGDLEEAADLLLGRPSEADSGDIASARRLYEQGQYQQAAGAWPGMFRNERRALKVLARTRGNRRRAFFAIDRNSRTFYVSAYQSHLFNQVVALRMAQPGLGRLVEGDLAQIHASGAVFTVRDVAVEQPRADAFEISPTGPLFGYRMTWPEGEPREIEAEILQREQLPEDAFKAGALRVKGTRRPLRVRPTDANMRLGADGRGAYLELRFGLPRGCYATSLLRELFRESRSLQTSAPEEDTEDSGG